jgi:hypothetical protein
VSVTVLLPHPLAAKTPVARRTTRIERLIERKELADDAVFNAQLRFG